MRILDQYKRFMRDRRGGTAIIFALATVPLLGAIATAVDYSRAANMQVSLQGAADSAALAAAALHESSRKKQREEAYNVFDANVADMDGLETYSRELTVSNDGLFTVTASGRFATSAAQLLGVDAIDVGVDATATFASQGTEISFAFDITNSMGFGTSWTDAMSAMESTLDTLQMYSGSNDFYVSLVPFSDRVNVGSSKSSWLAVAEPPGWDGCMIPREEKHGSFEWAMDDSAPTGLNKFYPNADPYKDTSHTKHYCPPHRIVEPTNNVDEIMNRLNSVTKGSTGRFDEGLVWTWRMLSPKWRGQWGVSNYPAKIAAPLAKDTDKDVRRKIAVMVTDGHTSIYRYEVGGDGSEPFGWNNGSPQGFEHVVHMCERMKDEGIEVHVMHVNGNDYATPYFEDCASPGAYTKVHNHTSLLEAMAGLAGKTTSLRLIR